MTDRIDPRAIVEELRGQVQGQCECPECVLATRAADTIDALVKEMQARELHHFEEEQKSAGLAAEVERLRLVHAGQARLAMSAVFLADTDDDAGVQAFRAEWVKEHDAALIESLADEVDLPGSIATWDYSREQVAGYRDAERDIEAWLHERARQVREGEA